jgi:ribose transport system permease protein
MDEATPASEVTPAPRLRQGPRERRKLPSAESYALVLAWVLVAAVFSVLRPDTFATVSNAQTIFGSQSVLVVLALGLLLPLVVGEFDLSIGANMGLAAVLVASLDVNHGWPILAVVVVAIAAGALIGVVNGVLVVLVGVDALVATLGIGTLLTGVAFAITNYIPIAGIDDSLVSAVSNTLFGLPFSFYYGLLLAAALWYAFRYTPFGRHLRFTGAGREVARLSGLNVTRLRMTAFVACGVIAAFAGVLLAGTFGSADPNNGVNFLLPAFAAAFLGSTAISPGTFNPWGTVVAVYFLVTGITGLQLVGLASWIQQVFYGASLVFAITLARLVATRRWKRQP